MRISDTLFPFSCTPTSRGGRSWLSRAVGVAALLASGLAVVGTAAAQTPSLAPPIEVNLAPHEPHIHRVDRLISAVVVGNNEVITAEAHDYNTVVIIARIEGKSRVILLDHSQNIVSDLLVTVAEPEKPSFVRLYRGVERNNFTCLPNCEPAPEEEQ